jgi:hypothetical protein
VAIQALLRNRIYCPRCGLLMVVRREGDSKKVYYHCARHYRIWDGKACGFRKFIPASWDEYIWDYTYALLMDNSWLERQLATEEDHQQAATRLIHVENRKIGQLQATITKVQIEEGIYGTEEAKNRIRDCQKAIVRAEEEIKRLQQRVVAPGLNRSGIDLLKNELESLRRANLESASFDDKLRLMSMLDIRVCPSEDLTTVRIKTRIGVDSNGKGGDQNHCRKVLFAPPMISIGRTPPESEQNPVKR